MLDEGFVCLYFRVLIEEMLATFPAVGSLKRVEPTQNRCLKASHCHWLLHESPCDAKKFRFCLLRCYETCGKLFGMAYRLKDCETKALKDKSLQEG